MCPSREDSSEAEPVTFVSPRSRRRPRSCGWETPTFVWAPEGGLQDSFISPCYDGSMKRYARPFQKLWIPDTLSGKSFNLTLRKTRKSFWQGASTDTYGYNTASFWGPTLIFNQGDTVTLKVTNALSEETTCHWHGLHLPAAMDGGPHQIIAPGKTWTATYTVKNNAATYWYHPHAHETTQKQLTYGAGGLIIVRDPKEAALVLPRTYGVDDIPLVFTSRRFYRDDQFTHRGDGDKYGDYLFANGTLDAEITLPAQWVRLRILNAEVERAYNLGLSDNRTFYLIGTDGGLVEKPIPLTRVVLVPGERVELLVDLSADKGGATLDLMAFNSGQTFGFPGQEPGRNPPNGGLLNNIDFPLLHINVGPKTARPITKLPATLVKPTLLTPAEVTNRRTLQITRGTDRGAEFAFDNQSYRMHHTDQTVKLGAVEVWSIVNNQVFGHAFHIHDVQFRIVSRSYGPVPDYENGWKDTLFIRRNETVQFVAKFEDFASETDPFMYHCHMANHEDMGLMGEFKVVQDPLTFRDKQEHPVTAQMALAAQKQMNTLAPARASLAHSKPLVVFFIEKNCPCSRDAAPFIERLRSQYGTVCDFVGVINSDASVAQAWAKAASVHFPLLPDPEREIIAAYKAERSVYTTLIAPGGRIAKTYPGYGQEMLKELSGRIAQLSGVRVRPLVVTGAPKNLIAGCEFERLRKAE